MKTEPTSSAQLIARARDGDTDALGGLYRAHARALFALAYRLTRSREESEDIVHDVFLGLPEALRHYQERGSSEAWLKRITARLALTRLRSARRFLEIDAQDLSQQASPGTEAISITGTSLSRAIDALPEGLRRVFLLKQVEGLSHPEIAALLEISEAASQVRFHRAIKLLRRKLTPDS